MYVLDPCLKLIYDAVFGTVCAEISYLSKGWIKWLQSEIRF